MGAYADGLGQVGRIEVRQQVERRREAIATTCIAQQCVIAHVIVHIPDENVEDHAPKQLRGILGGVIIERMPLYITNMCAAIGVTPSLTKAGAGKVAVRM